MASSDSGELGMHGAIVQAVEPVKDGLHEVLLVLASGEQRRLRVQAGGHPPLAVGQVGQLREANDRRGGWYFNAYLEQRLRRVPGRDVRDSGLWAWRLDGDDRLIELYEGVVPGVDGAFVPDATQIVEVGLPSEFVALCEERGRDPVDVLRGFMADLCGLQNYVRCPREDGLTSNGSDERMYADQYFERAYPDFGRGERDD
jgi:hypothetical protein